MSQSNPQTILDDVDSLPVEQPARILTVPLVATLLARNKSQADIARLFNVSKQAVSQFIQRNETELSALKDFEDVAINVMKHNVLRIQCSVDEKDIKKAGLSQKFVATGVGIEKIRLLQGESTQNVSVFAKIHDEAESVDNSVDKSEKDITPGSSSSDKPVDK
jgi:predicted transcriptional regulator